MERLMALQHCMIYRDLPKLWTISPVFLVCCQISLCFLCKGHMKRFTLLNFCKVSNRKEIHYQFSLVCIESRLICSQSLNIGGLYKLTIFAFCISLHVQVSTNHITQFHWYVFNISLALMLIWWRKEVCIFRSSYSIQVWVVKEICTLVTNSTHQFLWYILKI